MKIFYVRDLGTLSPKQDVSFKSLFSGLRGLCRRGKAVRAIGLDDNKETVFQTQLTDTVAAFTVHRSKPDAVPVLRWGSRYELPSLSKKLSLIDNH